MAASSSSATVAVEKATSDLLMGPDWTMNIEICDSINSNHWQPKDVVKAVKKRLQHRSSKVQLLALTLLETMVKNCGDFVHHQIAERKILDEMIKIVRKKTDMQVRDKILVLLDSWQEAFGGAGGKYPQYYWAYDELRRSGVGFPKRSSDAAPIFTPPPSHPALRNMQPGYGMPSNSSKTLDETMATEIETLSLSSLDSMRDVMDLLSDMLQAVNPSDSAATKDEVITDLVERCRTNQKKLMQMLTTSGDEELLGRGLELNDSIQSLLARHDAIASGAPLPIQGTSSSTVSTEVHSSVNLTEVKSSSLGVESVSTPKASPSALVLSETRGKSDEEEEDEFAQLARRHSKTQSMASRDAAASSPTPHLPEPSTSVPLNALALPDPPAPISTTSKDQDIIDLLSITLSLTPSSPQTSYAPPVSAEGYSYAPSQTSSYPGNLSYNNSYVAPWALPQSKSESQPPTPPSPQQFLHHQHTQPQQQSSQHVWQQQPPQAQFQSQNPPYSPPQQHLQQQLEPQQLHSQPQPHPHSHSHSQHQPQPQLQSQPQPLPQLQSQPQPQPQLQSKPQPQLQLQTQQSQLHPQFQNQQPQPQPQFQNQHVQYPARYPPPPWAATPGYANYQNHLSATNMFSTTQASTTASSYAPAQRVIPLQHNNSFPSRPISDPMGNSGPHSNPASVAATGQQNQKPFVPSYRLFEDLNVFGNNTDGRSSASSSMGPGMVGGRK